MSINDDLLDAVRKQDYEKVTKCLIKGADVNYYKDCQTPLCIATNNHDIQMVNLLLETDRVTAKELKTILQIAMTLKNKEISKILIDHMQDFKQGWFDIGIYESFHKLAIDNAWPDILKSLLCKGARFKKCEGWDVNPLHYAAKQKDPIYVQLLGKYIDVDDTKDEEETPLMIAAEAGNDETMDALLKMGANLQAKPEPKVHINFLIPSILRAGVIKMNLVNIDSVLHKAVSSGNTKTIDVLLKHKPDLDLNARGSESKTPLMIAAERGDNQMVHHLLKLGVNVNIRRGEGNALHSAVEGDSIESIKLLLAYGIDQHHQTNNYQTPLSKAINEHKKYGVPSKEVIDLLTYAKANPKKVVSQKPTYFPGRNPKGGRGPRE